MARKPDAQKQITAFASAHTGFTLASQTDSLALANSTRDLDLIILDFARACPTQRNRSRRSVQRFFQCNHDVGLDIGSALGSRLTSAKSAESRAAAAASEKGFEKVAESGTAELELNATAIAAPLVISAFRWLWAPLWRRLESARSVPICAELIVFCTFLRVAQYLVRFVDLLKFFLSSRLVLGDVGMMLARQFAKSAANLIFGGRLGHTQGLVIISELYGHSLSSLCLRSIRATF